MGRKADRRHLQRGRGGAVPLEGLGAERRRRSGCGCWTASPTGCGRGSPSSPARCTTTAGCRWWRTSTAGTTATSATCATSEPLARVALVYSQQTAQFYGGEQARQKVEDHTLGYYQALIEARIPFEMVHDRLLDAEHIDRFKVLILPNIAALSDAAVRAAPRVSCERGGSIVATHETSLYDEWGVRARGFRTGGSVRRVVRRRASTRACRTRTCVWNGRRRQASSDAGGPGGRRAHHQRRLARAHANHRRRIRIRRSR